MIQDNILDDKEVYEVNRIDDGAFIGFYATMKEANILKAEYEAAWDEPCEVHPTYVLGPQSLNERHANRIV